MRIRLGEGCPERKIGEGGMDGDKWKIEKRY